MSDNTPQDPITTALRTAIDHAPDADAREMAREAYGQHLQARQAQEAPKPTRPPGIPLLALDPREEAQRHAEGQAMVAALQSSNGVTRPQPLGQPLGGVA